MTKREELIAAVRALLPEDVNDWLADNITDAVLAALREPDEGMRKAADEVSFELTEPGALSVILKGYTAMIEAAAISPPEGMGEELK